MSIDYEKLLKRCMEVWCEAEGSCWVGDRYYGDEDITDEERETLQSIFENVSASLERKYSQRRKESPTNGE